MENVKSIAREMGCTDIRLTCAPQNAAAIGLYESLGMGVKCIQYCIQIGSMSIVGVETKTNNRKSCRSKNSGTIFMYGRRGFCF